MLPNHHGYIRLVLNSNEHDLYNLDGGVYRSLHYPETLSGPRDARPGLLVYFESAQFYDRTLPHFQRY